MWLFTKHGFYSATRSNTVKGFMQIRARCRGDLENLKREFQLTGKIIETPQADYRWRIVCRPTTWEMLALKLAQDVDYSNFKNSVGDDQHDKPLMAVWSAMHRFQEDDLRKAKAANRRLPLFEGGFDEDDDALEIGGHRFHR
jgi:hypothetical protein